MADALTVERLGWQRLRRPDGGVVERPVWVMWLNAPDRPIAAQLPSSYVCGACGEARSLDHLRALPDLQALQIRKVSVSCPCGASVHFDSTPLARRGRLRWPRQFRARPLTDTDAECGL